MAKLAEFDRLFDLTEKSLVPPENLLAAVEGLPPVAKLPLPWAAWLLIVLIRYRRRQRWATRKLTKHFPRRSSPSGTHCGRWEHDPPLTVTIRGMPEWELRPNSTFPYGFLTHKVTGEMITVWVSPP